MDKRAVPLVSMNPKTIGGPMEMKPASIQAVPYRLIERPAFRIAGRQTFISGPDNDQFGRFWQECRAQGWLSVLDNLAKEAGTEVGPQTGAAFLGVSRVEKDPSHREFNYMISVEIPMNVPERAVTSLDLELYEVPACRWAVFECHGKPPQSIVNAEMFAFMQWLPSTNYRHALAPEMEVYPARSGPNYAEFWLPIES